MVNNGEVGRVAGIEIEETSGCHSTGEIPMGYFFLPLSKVWVFREPGKQIHLRPDGRIVRIEG